METIEKFFAEDFIVVASRAFDKPGTRTRPKGEEFERNYVIISNFDKNLFTFFSIRFHLSRRFCTYTCSELPIAFTYHCAERLMERGRNITQAATEISLSLMEMFIFSKIAEPVARTELHDLMVLPAIELEGAFLGEYQDHAPYDFRFDFGVHETMSPNLSGVTSHRRYLVKTFVDDKRLSVKQDEIIDKIFDWRVECDEFHDQAMVKALWPQCFMTEDELAVKGLGIGQHMINYLKSPKTKETIIRKLKTQNASPPVVKQPTERQHVGA